MKAPAILYFLPVIALISVLILVPEILAVYVSLSKSVLTIDYAFRGLHWYQYLSTDPRLVNDFYVSIYWMITSVIISYFVGLFLAVAFRGGDIMDRIVRISMLCVWVMMPVAAGLMWNFIDNFETGVFSSVLYYLGLPKFNLFLSPFTALNAVLLAMVWREIPVAMIFLWAGLKSINPSIWESSMLDGAGPVARLWHVTMPLLKTPTIAVLILLLLAGAFTVDLPITITNGGPYYATENLAMRIYDEGFLHVNWGLTAALGVVGLVVAVVFLFPLLRSVTRRA